MEPIFHNSNICSDKKLFYNANWHQKDIGKITECITSAGECLSLLEFQNVHDFNVLFVTYYGILKTINTSEL